MLVYHCSTKINLDPTLVTVNENKELCLSTQRFIYSPYLLVASRRKKESMETKTAALVSKKKQYIMVRKKRAGRDLDFFSNSNMLDRV